MKRIFWIAPITLAACTYVDASPEALKNYPSEYLCRLLEPDYFTSPQEQIDIYRELENRGQKCVSSNDNVNQTVIVN